MKTSHESLEATHNMSTCSNLPSLYTVASNKLKNHCVARSRIPFISQLAIWLLLSDKKDVMFMFFYLLEFELEM